MKKYFTYIITIYLLTSLVFICACTQTTKDLELTATPDISADNVIPTMTIEATAVTLPSMTPTPILTPSSTSTIKPTVQPTATPTPKLFEENNIQVGSIIYFGSYEQDTVLDNGNEKIEWKVIDKRDGKALLMSVYGLNTYPYETGGSSVSATWEDSDLRRWMNNEFFNDAFSEKEKNFIAEVTNVPDAIPNGYPIPGNSTQDKVFTLSVSEVNKYFKYTGERICLTTKYAKRKTIYDIDNKCKWWLRNPGNAQDEAYYVDITGELRYTRISLGGYVVRPFIWIKIT